MKTSAVVLASLLGIAVVGCVQGSDAVDRADDPMSTAGAGSMSSVPVDSGVVPSRSAQVEDLAIDYRPSDFYVGGSPVPESTGPGAEGAFRISCRGGHLSYDDPIIFPDQSGASHLHQYFGNLSIDATTTVESIEQSGESTCQGGPINRSGYWIPALVDGADESVIPIDVVVVYYKGEPAEQGSSLIGDVSPLPEGLTVVSDDYTWSCGTDRIGSDCSEMTLTIRFGWCWNGQTDSADHRSHLVFPGNEASSGQPVCPESHPTPIPRITYNVHYDIAEASPSSNWYLASDRHQAAADRTGHAVPAIPGSTAHGDYMEGWGTIDSTTGETGDRVWWRECLIGFRDSSFGHLCDGRMLTWPGGGVEQPSVPVPPRNR